MQSTELITDSMVHVLYHPVTRAAPQWPYYGGIVFIASPLTTSGSILDSASYYVTVKIPLFPLAPDTRSPESRRKPKFEIHPLHFDLSGDRMSEFEHARTRCNKVKLGLERCSRRLTLIRKLSWWLVLRCRWPSVSGS